MIILLYILILAAVENGINLMPKYISMLMEWISERKKKTVFFAWIFVRIVNSRFNDS